MYSNILTLINLGFNYKRKLTSSYENLKKKKKINNFYKIKENIVKNLNQSFKFNCNNKTHLFLKTKFELDVSKSLAQFIYSKFFFNKIFHRILIHGLEFDNRILYPMPFCIIETLELEKIKVYKHINLILWKFFIIIYLFKSTLNLIYSFLTSRNNRIFKNDISIIYFNSIPKINFNKENKNKNLITFFLNFLNINKSFLIIHDNKNITQSYFKFNNQIYHLSTNENLIFFDYKDFSSFREFLKLLFEVFKFIKKINILETYLLITDFYKFFYLKKNTLKIPKYCLFNNSNYIYRPLWTYVRVSKCDQIKFKNRTLVYFYSTNISPIFKKKEDNQSFDLAGCSLITWPEYVVWSEEQKKFLQSFCKMIANYTIVDYVPFEGNRVPKKKIDIAIFDNPPKNDFIKSHIINGYNIYDYDYCRNFLLDIIDYSSRNELNVALKVKRFYQNIHSEYLTLLKKIISLHKNIKIYDENYSAEQIIKKSKLTISIPFSTPALIAEKLKRETVFYDPSGTLVKNKYNPQKIVLISKKQKLNKFLNYVFKK